MSHQELTSISVVIPIYNEEENISELYRRLRGVLDGHFSTARCEMIFVDDGSKDKSIAMLEALHQKDARVHIVQFSRNFGHHMAVTAGLDHAKGDVTVLMDGDLQDRPEDIPALVGKIGQGFDLVYAVRKGGDDGGGFTARMGSHAFVWLMKQMVREPMAIETSIFRAMRRNVLEEVKQMRERDRFLIGLIDWVGFSQGTVEVMRDKRFAGETKYPFKKRVRLALNAMFSFSTLPLEMAGTIGFIVTIVSFVMGVYFLMKKLFWGVDVQGFASLIVSIFFLGGVQLIILGVLGAYIGRIYMEAKRRPLYIVKKIIE